MIIIDEEDLIKEFFSEGVAVRSNPNALGDTFFVRVTKDFYEIYEPTEMHISRNDPTAREVLENFAWNLEYTYSCIKDYIPFRTTLLDRKYYRTTLKDLIHEIREDAKKFGEAILGHYGDGCGGAECGDMCCSRFIENN